MEETNLLLEELPGASPEDHLSARGLVSAGWAAWTRGDNGKPQVDYVGPDMANATRWVGEGGGYRVSEIFFKG